MSKVISGLAKGVNLEVFPKKNLRPTSNRAKEALFDIIQFDIKDKVFLDLFSGTGQIGIEAISRGAKKVIFVDKSSESIGILKRNIKKLPKICAENLNIEIHKKDCFYFLEKFKNKVDFLFADAPFDMKIDENALLKFSKVMKNEGTIIIETSSSDKKIDEFGNFYLMKKYKYGSISLSFYVQKAERIIERDGI